MTRRDSKKPNRYKTKKRSLKESIKFLIVALILIVVVDQMVLDGERSYRDKMTEDYYAEQAEKRSSGRKSDRTAFAAKSCFS